MLDDEFGGGRSVHRDYCSPENIKGECHYKSELWALGNLFFELYGNITELTKPIGQTFNEYIEEYMEADIMSIFAKAPAQKQIPKIIDVIFEDNEKFKALFNQLFCIQAKNRKFFSM